MSDKHTLCWKDFNKLKMAAMRFIKKLRRKLLNASELKKSTYEIIIDYLCENWSKLFCIGLLTKQGIDDSILEILIPRTNNIVEQKYRYIKQQIRSITGKKQIGKEFDRLGKAIALVSNLENDYYVSEIYGSINKIAECFSKIPHPIVKKVEDKLKRELKGITKFKISQEKFDHEIDRLMEIKQMEISQKQQIEMIFEISEDKMVNLCV